MKIETAEDLAAAKNMSFAPDQKRELEIGCEIWHISGEGWTGSMCRWPGGRGAFMAGGDSCWGEWDGDSLLLDETNENGLSITVDEDGEESVAESLETVTTDFQETSNVQNFIVHNAHKWNFDLSAPDGITGKSVLTVTSQNYESDSGCGQSLVVSAFFRLCEILEVDKAGEMIHSGGYVRCEVLPESEGQE